MRRLGCFEVVGLMVVLVLWRLGLRVGWIWVSEDLGLVGKRAGVLGEFRRSGLL